MAFIDFGSADARVTTAPRASLPLPAASPGQSTRPPLETLSALEWRVVDLARGDGLATLLPHRKRGWIARLLLGPQPPSPKLADDRLEALRRLAVRAWHEGYRVRASAIREAIAAGFTELQAGRVIDTIVARRIAERRAAA